LRSGRQQLRTEQIWLELREKLETFYAEQTPGPPVDVDRVRHELQQAARVIARIQGALEAAERCPNTRIAEGLIRDAARDATFALGSITAATEALGGGS
jgi:hypothetical protein